MAVKARGGEIILSLIENQGPGFHGDAQASWLSRPAGQFAPGSMALGCNYWASHAGTSMWNEWRPEVVEEDMRTLASCGVTWLRVFPLWPDFQPLAVLRGQYGVVREFQTGDAPMGNRPAERSGLSPIMLERFKEFCRLAERYDLKLVVGLITGWMSGRLFVPPALETFNPITDARSITWQVKFVDRFVRSMREDRAIDCWDLGNECNCMGEIMTPEQAYLWTAVISNTIRAADPTRPVVSGMHSLCARVSGHPNNWHIEDQAALTDVLTTHPYPYWVRHADLGRADDFWTTFHATAETCFYRDIAGKPCIVEEIGTMGPMIAADTVAAGFARVNLWSLWANDCRGFAWWCSHDQTELVQPSYQWNGVEVELGLIRADGSPKPVMDEIRTFKHAMTAINNGHLPPPRADAVCILSRNQDDWAAAYGTFVLAKQAKLNLRFTSVDQELPESSLYILPSLVGPDCVSRDLWLTLIEGVRDGATLYVSLADGIVARFEEVFGARIVRRSKRKKEGALVLRDDPSGAIPLVGAHDVEVQLTSGELLGEGDDGAPVFWSNNLGRGLVYALVFPMETALATSGDAFLLGNDENHWKI